MGGSLESLIRARHRRLLLAVGHGEQLDPPADGHWAAGEPAHREGCELENYVDGAETLPRIAEALAGARSHVHIAGCTSRPGSGSPGILPLFHFVSFRLR